MKLFPKRKSDDEYVEALRKHAKCSKWVGVAFLLVFFLYAFCFCAQWFSMAESAKDLEIHAKYSIYSNFVFDSYDVGFGLGAMSCLYVFMLVFSIGAAIIMLKGNRTVNLLYKYYDEVKSIEVKSIGEQETDGECDEAVRKKAKTAKWVGVVVFLLSSFLYIFFYCVSRFSMFATMKKHASDTEYFLDSWNSGFSYGAVSCLLMIVAFFFFGEALTVLLGKPNEKLLIKYYDKAKRNNEREE